ncbi:MAG: ATP-binding protein [Myxococcota bacterium]
MNDDLDQLLDRLKLRRIREILDRELKSAEKTTPSYSDFLTRLLREEHQTQQERFLEHRIRRARLPERWALQTYPWKQQPVVKRTQIEQELFDEMYRSLADHSSRKLLNRLVDLDLIVIDEMGYLNLRPEQSNIFFKLMEERYGKKATIITTNLPYEDWYGFLGNKEMVGALLDRLLHHCTTIQIDGASLRTPQG